MRAIGEISASYQGPLKLLPWLFAGATRLAEGMGFRI